MTIFARSPPILTDLGRATQTYNALLRPTWERRRHETCAQGAGKSVNSRSLGTFRPARLDVHARRLGEHRLRHDLALDDLRGKARLSGGARFGDPLEVGR